MTIPEKENKDRDTSDARRRRRSTKPKTPLPPKYPKASPPSPLTYLPRYQAASLPPSVRENRYISSRSSSNSASSSASSTSMTSGMAQRPTRAVDPHDTPSFDPHGKPMAPPPNSAYFPPPTPETGDTPMTPSTSAAQSASTFSPSFVESVNAFGLDMLSTAIDLNPTKSAGLCAMNIYHCLSMVALGSKDRNLDAFAEVLGFKPELLETMISHTLALDRYSKTSPAVDFSSASAIFPDRNFILEDSWKNLILEKFEAEIGPLEIVPINAFIERETRGKFKDLIKPADLAGTVLMLVSCLYFKAKWLVPFKSKQTEKNAIFFNYEGEQMPCKLMYKCEKMEYIEDGKCQIAILPYKSDEQGPKWKAAIILPKERGLSAMHDLLTSFTASPKNLRQLLLGSNDDPQPRGHDNPTTIPPWRKEKVALHVPRFSLKLNLDLIPALRKLGLGPAFIPSDGFAPMSKDGPLAIGRATHDLFLEVNEEGTEMAAVTVVAVTRGFSPVTEMRVDRPFIFIVFDASSGLVLCEVVVNEIPA